MRLIAGRAIPIKLKIFFMLLIVILPISVVETIDILNARQGRIETSKASLLSLAKEGAGRYVEIVAKSTTLLDIVKEIPIAQLQDISTCIPIFKNIASQKSWVVTVGISEANGTAICGNAMSPGPRPNFADRPYFKQALAATGPVVSDVVFSRVPGAKTAGKPIFVVAEALRDAAGAVYAVVSVAVDVNWANSLAERIGQKAEGSVLLLDRQGMVLTQSSHFSYNVGSSIPDAPWLPALLENAEGTLEASAPDGTVQLIGYATIESAGVKILVSQPKAVVVAAADERLVKSSFELALALLIAAALAWIAVELMLLRWIARLARAAERLGVGDFNTRCDIPAAAGEFAVVGQALDDASRRLGQRAAEMKEAEAALRASDERYRLLAENSSDLVTFKKDLNSPRTYVSPGVRAVTGLEPEEFLNISLADFMHPDDLDRVSKELAQLTPDHPSVTSTHRLRHKSGHWVWVEAVSRLAAVGTADEGIIVNSRDVTARVVAEMALQESEARYRLLVENATDLVFQLNASLAPTYVSPACKEILGYEVDEMLGKTPAEIIHPDDAAEVERVHRSVIEGVDRAMTVNRARHRDGHWVWLEADLRALRDPVTQAVIGVVGALRDISARKRAEAILEASEARFRMLAENAVDMITHIGPEGRRKFVSPACRKLLGYEPEEMIGGTPEDLSHPDDWPALKASMDELDKGRIPGPVQFRALRKDGSYLWVETSGKVLENGKGKILATRDIDRRKRAEDELDNLILELKKFAHLDALTAIANRRSFDDTIEREISRAMRTGAPISLIFADVDNFKAYNDMHGHRAGDECLKQIARSLRSSLRGPGDLAARYGGEEFAAILPDTMKGDASSVAEAFRAAVEAEQITHAGSPFGLVTVSVGVVTLNSRQTQLTACDLIERADQALYAAKSAGKNCIRLDGADPTLTLLKAI